MLLRAQEAKVLEALGIAHPTASEHAAWNIWRRPSSSPLAHIADLVAFIQAL